MFYTAPKACHPLLVLFCFEHLHQVFMLPTCRCVMWSPAGFGQNNDANTYNVLHGVVPVQLY